MELFSELQPWHWFVLGTALLVLEIFGAGGFLIGMAAAAFIVAIFTYFTDSLSWEWQLIHFAVDAVVLTFLYLKFFNRFNQTTDAPQLNDRAAQLIGTQFQLADGIHSQGSVQIGDTRWKVCCEGHIEAGSHVHVTASDGMTLIIAPTTD
jgi:membrane protein implicated in regulation of membrane protease activity